MAEIQLREVTKRYPDGTEAVKQVSLDIGDGEFMILVGPSGCGKSTALRMIAGLEEISDGDLLIGGERVNDLAPRDRDIAMVFQNYALYPHMTVRENMGFALKLAKEKEDEIRKRVDEAARILDLEQHLERKPANLSGGQRQRVAMGRAIVRSPKVFLMDEPLSNLDAKLRVQMRTEVSRIQQRVGTTTVYVTHDQTEAMTLGDRVAVMRGGIIQQVDTPKNLYEKPDNLFVAGFIGSPSMNFLPARLEGDTIKLPFGDAPLPDELRGRLQGRRQGARRDRGRAAGALRGRRGRARQAGPEVPAPVSVVESMGSELYAYFDVEAGGGGVLRARRAGGRLGHGGPPAPRRGDAQQVVARLAAASRARPGEQAEMVLDTRHIQLFDPHGRQEPDAAEYECRGVRAACAGPRGGPPAGGREARARRRCAVDGAACGASRARRRYRDRAARAPSVNAAQSRCALERAAGARRASVARRRPRRRAGREGRAAARCSPRPSPRSRCGPSSPAGG